MNPAPLHAQPLGRRELALYAGPSLALAGVGLPLIALLPTYYASELGLNLSAVGVVFMAVRLLDIGLDPVLGVLMDRTRTPWGRFRPWLVAGVPIMMLATAVLFFARSGVGPLYLGAGLTLASSGTLSATGGGIYAPLVNGDLPGPTLIADPFGQCVMVQIR